ncbi:bifunctional adenosylcobinamide kinase/adenosylcobinamide-phosphate guanylyltransferase [Planotetraspora sp. GP83]|uniref:bifunctional adenosylcobinamide kinase/adenosylcobinamide-phosphate guanylyltransferase n=1 Tax=Planotetraspora sp. GP83 TaxID=3156264 RepID=UPI003517A6B9
MEVFLEGTAGPDGWPAPGCPCASCGRLPPGHRRPASLVLNGQVRLSPANQPPRTDALPAISEPPDGPGLPQGHGLPGGYVLRHGPDGCEIIDPAGGRLLYATHGVVQAAPSHAATRPRVLSRPDECHGVAPRAPGAGPGRDDPGALRAGRGRPLACEIMPYAAEPYDLVLIDLLDRPDRLGDLRHRGLVTSRTQVIAVHLDHRVPSEGELARRLGFWQARAVPDGTVLTAAPKWESVEVGRRPRRTLLLGGSRSGKSEEAELRVAADPDVTYVATGPSGGDDPSWLARVKAHRDRRPAHWRTVETVDLTALLRDPPGTLLIDGLGTWLAAVFDECGAWPGDLGDTPAPTADHGEAPPLDHMSPLDRVARRCDELVDAWRHAPGPVVAVSDEVGLGVVPATASGRLFRDALGRLNQRLARESEDVALVVAGRVTPLPI